ncbi:MAG: hypothetical protein JJT81_08055 [Rubellimicrobium sp.]|nr:hypothetical protein [Rubellimicrobium sp.]
MAEDLRGTAEHRMRAWGCTPDGDAIVTDDAFLMPVRRVGVPLMLKVADPDGDEVGAAAILAALGGRGAVQLVEAAGSALLMERVTHAGPSLAQMALGGQDGAAMTVLIDLTLEVQAGLAGVDLPDLIPFDRRMAAFAEALAEPGLDGATVGLLARLSDMGHEIAGDPAGWIALHGDMHHFNALHDAARGWLMIDPKGILGPAPFDFANMILNPLPHADLVMAPARMERMAGMVAERLGTPAREVLLWVCLQAGLGLAWSLWDSERPYWERGLEVASGLAGLRL